MADNAGMLQFQNVKDYIKRKIAEVDPQIDTRDNSGIGDILIKPLVDLLQPIVDEAIRIQNNQSLLNAESMTESELDALIANIFLTRRVGAKARGTVRIYFSEPENVTVPQSSEFVTADGSRFFCLSEVTITANQMSINREGDFFYVDILVEAEDIGAAGNVPAGSIVDFIGGPPNLVKVDNLGAFTGGVDQEGNTAFVDRAKEAITVRDLVSTPAIKTVLLEEFPVIQDIKVIGYGDPEMERDFLVGDNMELGLFPPIDVLHSTVGLHIGGKVDVYIRSVTLTEETVRIDNLKQNVILRPKDAYDPVVDPPNVQYVGLVKRPIIDIVSIQPIDPVTGDPIGNPLIKGIDYIFVVDNPTVRFSTRERDRLFIMNGLLLNGSYVLKYKHSTDVVEIQEYVEADARRVVTADLLVKFTNPAFFDLSIVVTIDPLSGATTDTLQAKIEEFINNLGVGARIEASDIVDLLYDNGASFVQLPFTMTATVYQSDGTETVITSQNVVVVPATAAYLPRTVVVTEV